jgi:ribosomal protein S18 acetylase RimI-like enzyme
MLSRVSTVRAIGVGELARFDELDPGARIGEDLAAAWADGSSRPEWTLVAEVDGRPMARGALVVEPTGGGVEALEGTAAFLWADVAHPDHPDALKAVLDGLADRLRPLGPTTLNRRLNRERHADIDRMRILLERAGFTLLQEKEGFGWSHDLPAPPASGRLAFRSLGEIGLDAYRDVMAAATAGTLDGNDRYYVELCGPTPWATEMLGYREPEDDDSWLIGCLPDGAPVGYVAVGALGETETWTIVHIGVVPEHRGHGYVRDLLAAADVVARRRSFTAGLSDVDVENAPMMAAMAWAGHRPDLRRWHIWHYRRVV